MQVVLVKEEGMEWGDQGHEEEQFKLIKMEKVTNTSDHTSHAEFPMTFFRSVSCQTGLLTCPHGSVKLFQGDTCVVAAVFGPTEVRMSKEVPHRGAVDVLYRPKVTGMSQLSSPVMDPVLGERTMESILISIFESSIHLEDIVGLGYSIILHEFEDDGNLLSACVNATTIALLDGGCSLRHPVAAVTLILTKDDKPTLIVDPSSSQLKKGYKAIFTYAISNGMEILYANVLGHVSPEVLKIVQTKACEAAKEMFKFFHFLALKKSRNPVTGYHRSIPTSFKMDIKTEPMDIKQEVDDYSAEDGELTNESDD